MRTSFLRGERVRLRAMEPEDLDTLYNMENDPESWEVTDFTVPYSRNALRQYIEDSQNDLFSDRQLRLMIEETAGGQTVGSIDLFDFSPMHARAELGMAVMRQFRGNGYAREALDLMCRYAFGFLHLKQLTVHIAVSNERCLGMFRDYGFCQCGVLKSWWRSGGRYLDVALLQMVRPE